MPCKRWKKHKEFECPASRCKQQNQPLQDSTLCTPVSPSPSAASKCACKDKKYNNDGCRVFRNTQCPIHNRPTCRQHQPSTPCKSKCNVKNFDDIMNIEMPQCQAMLRSLADDAMCSVDNLPALKDVSVQDSKRAMSCTNPICPRSGNSAQSSNWPTPTVSCPILPKGSCNQPGYVAVPQYEHKKQKSTCSLQSCTKDIESQSRSICEWMPNSDPGLSKGWECVGVTQTPFLRPPPGAPVPAVPRKRSNTCVALPAPILKTPSRKTSICGVSSPPCRQPSSSSIATKSSKKSSLNLSKKESKKLEKMRKDEEKRLKKEEKRLKKEAKKEEKKMLKNLKKGKKSVTLLETCSDSKCYAKTKCQCRFPPAFTPFYGCTAQISGCCQCDCLND